MSIPTQETALLRSCFNLFNLDVYSSVQMCLLWVNIMNYDFQLAMGAHIVLFGPMRSNLSTRFGIRRSIQPEVLRLVMGLPLYGGHGSWRIPGFMGSMCPQLVGAQAMVCSFVEIVKFNHENSVIVVKWLLLGIVSFSNKIPLIVIFVSIFSASILHGDWGLPGVEICH